MLVSCGSRAGSELAPAALTVSELPGTGLRVSDRIEAIDLAADRSGALHLVWVAALLDVPGTLPSHRLFYARGDASGGRWTAPKELAESAGPLAVVAGDRAVTVVSGPRLLRHDSEDGGESWQARGELLPADLARAEGFDLALATGGPLAAVLVRPDPGWEVAQRGPRDRQRLLLVGGGVPGESSARSLAEFPASLFAAAAPKLLADGSRLDIALGLNLEQRSGSAVAERGRLFHLRSTDGGATWGETAEIPLAAAPDAGGRIAEVALAATARGLLLFATGTTTRVSRQETPASWSAPRTLGAYRTSLSKGEARATSVDAAAGAVAWIDHRYRRSDRRIWNPLGGLPWSDDNPLWANNDLFAMPLAEVAALLDGTAKPEPSRLTGPLSFAGSVRLVGDDGPAVVLWSGRRQVGKERGAAGAPPGIFYAVVTGGWESLRPGP